MDKKITGNINYILIAVFVITSSFGINYSFGTHITIGKWDGYEREGKDLISKIKLSVSGDNTAIYYNGFFQLPCYWSKKSHSSIVLKCVPYTGGEMFGRVFTFKMGLTQNVGYLDDSRRKIIITRSIES